MTRRASWVVVAAIIATGIGMIWRTRSVCPSDEEIWRVGQPIIDAVERYHVERGTYPESLAILGVHAPSVACYGTFRYQAPPGAPYPDFVVGEYGRDGQVVGWSGGRRFVDR